MRVTIVNQYFPPDLSPTAHLVASLARHRAARGDEVTVVSSAARYVDGEGEGDVDTPNLRVWRGPAPRVRANGLWSRAGQYAAFYLTSAWKLLTMPRQDVVICLTTPPFAAMLGVLHRWRRRSTRLVLWSMDCYPEILEATRLVRPGGVTARVCRLANRWLFKRIDQVVCLDSAMRTLLQSQYAANGHGPDFSIVPNWECADAFLLPFDRLIMPADRLCITYLGNAGYGHEFDTVIEAADALRHEPVTFQFIGGGVLHEKLRLEARNRGLINIVLRPYVPKRQTPALLARSDLSLVTLSDAALGVMSPSKIHAALAMGVPLVYVGPRGGNVDEAISRFGCGISLRHGASGELAEFIRGVLYDEPRRRAPGRLAREAFEQAYSDECSLPLLDDVIERMPRAA